MYGRVGGVWGVFDHSYTCLRIEDRGRGGAGEHSGCIDHTSAFLRIEYSVWEAYYRRTFPLHRFYALKRQGATGALIYP